MTPEERAGKIEVPWIWNQLYHGGQLDLQALRVSIANAIREAVEAERNRCCGIVAEKIELQSDIVVLIRDLSKEVGK